MHRGTTTIYMHFDVQSTDLRKFREQRANTIQGYELLVFIRSWSFILTMHSSIWHAMETIQFVYYVLQANVADIKYVCF